MSDPRFSTHDEFWKNTGILLEMAEEGFLKKSSAEWVAIFAGLDIACARLNSIRETIEDEQAWVNGYLEYYDMLCGERCVISRLPLSLESCVNSPLAPAPLFGENTVDILTDMGFGAQEIESLAADGAVVIRIAS
jgi:crotonobetainyl-CoA:carnitine CoA-transferase CaiB-like acyl-CoA transferase